MHSLSPTLLLLDRHGEFLAQMERDEKNGYGYWPLERLPPRVVTAALALEDRRFWNHPGIDLLPATTTPFSQKNLI